MSSAPAIGIDLGTTYSCVAVYRNGRAEIIPNAEGNRITPSYVAFTDTERLVGEAAKNQDALNPINTIFDAKRLIGRKFNDPSVQDDMKLWPFRVINENGKPKILVKYKGQDKTLFPEQVSSIVLTKMKETAEAYLGKKVQNAVITVPAYFSDSQRQATKDAGTIAGLNVLRIINEPTAGALAYGLGDKDEEERNVLIYDLGGGTFDVSIMTIEAGVFEVRSTAGDTHLGGEDFDNNMVDHFVQEFNRNHQLDIRRSPKAIRRLRTQCERAKRNLSTSTEATVELDSLYEGVDFRSIITRARFEAMNGTLIKSTIEQVKKALNDAEMSKSDISDVVLVGGSTRIPMVQRLLQEFFDGKELNKSVNPDEAVAAGAAIQAANLDGDLSEQIKDLVLVDVTPLSLGTDMTEDRMSVIIKRNTTIPTRKTERYYTVSDNQTEMGVEVREGERPMASDNNLLGKFTLEGIPPMPAGDAKVDVTFEIDANGILHASAFETVSGNNKKIIIEKGRLSDEQIQRMLDDAERFKVLDQRRREAAEARNALESYCIGVQSNISDMRSRGEISNADGRTILDKCEETIDWVGSTIENGAKDILEKKKQLERMYDTIVKVYNMF